jgi:hypothetical protein
MQLRLWLSGWRICAHCESTSSSAVAFINNFSGTRGVLNKICHHRGPPWRQSLRKGCMHAADAHAEYEHMHASAACMLKNDAQGIMTRVGRSVGGVA